jgi:A nuclease family of the HNH/ENDO VII superfamily with conserved AHH
MTEIAEAVAVALGEPITEKCPFKEEGPDVSPEVEDVINDDRDSADVLQDNNGGTLGKNLIKGSPDGWGKDGTINKLYPPSMTIAPQPRVDSKMQPSLKVTVQNDDYPFKVAAHHLVPGDASLSPSELYLHYMVKDATGQTAGGRQFTIKANIGYNVNGNHNGVWLPGNYAIRQGATKKQVSWRELGEDPWCFEYMKACVAKTGGQFHDAHTHYSGAVLKILNKIHVLIGAHQDSGCEDCSSKTELYPPYRLKVRLYVLSRYLRSKLRMAPGKWKYPWFTSDRFKDEMMRAQMLKP